MAKVNILGVGVDDIDTPGLERAVLNSIQKGTKEIFAYANIHTINAARHSDKFRDWLNGGPVVYCDGDGVRFGAKLLGQRLPPKTVLTRWVWELGALFQKNQVSVFLLGGSKDTVSLAADRWIERFPQLKVVGFHHGYFSRNGRENEDVISMINDHSPGVLFVGFGTPEQELWIRDHFKRLKVNSIIPCGGMIEYLAGARQSPPEWMVHYRMEWMHRLFQDPLRMWKRYVIGNPAFMFQIVMAKMRKGKVV